MSNEATQQLLKITSRIGRADFAEITIYSDCSGNCVRRDGSSICFDELLKLALILEEEANRQTRWPKL